MLDLLLRRLKVLYSASNLFQKLFGLLCSSYPYQLIVKTRINLVTSKPTPINLIIETSNRCNAACLMCPQGSMKRLKRLMDDETFDMIIVRLRKENLLLNKIFLSGMGEPLFDQSIIGRLKQLKSLGAPIKLFTNASLLTPSISRELISLGLDEINISFNGTDAENYRKVMNLDYNKTLKNINSLIELKRACHSKKPLIRVSSVLLQQNEASIAKHLAAWKSDIESVGVSIAHEWGGGVSSRSDHHFDRRRAYPCRSLWHTLNIDCSGNFVICCRDYESKFTLGNIKTHSFKEVQKSPLLRKFRDLHQTYEVSQLPEICKKCNFPFQEGVEWFMPRTSD